MAQIMIPKKKSPTDIFPVAGQAVGGALGYIYGDKGGPGTAAGAQAGGMVGGMVKGVADGMSGQAKKDGAMDTLSQSSAMTRRMQSMDEDPLSNIRQAQNAIQFMPPEVKQEYSPVLDEAYKRALAQRQQSGGIYG